MLLIHKFYAHAANDINHYNSLNAMIQDTSSYRKLQNNLKKKFNLSKRFPEYFNQRYSAAFDESIKNAAKALGEPHQGRFNSYALQSRQEILSLVATLKQEGKDIQEQFESIGKVIDEIDNFEDSLSQELAMLAIENPILRNIMGIKESDIPDGRYDINSNALFANVNGKINQINNLIKKIDSNTPIDDAAGLGWAIYSAYTKLAGFLYEAENLKGLVQNNKEGTATFIHTGVLHKEIKNDIQLSEDEKIYENILNEIDAIVSSISTSTPKADIMGFQDGVYAGLSIKTASETKIGKTGFGARTGIPIGSTYKTVLQILAENKNTVNSLLGKPYLPYLTQTIVSAHQIPSQMDGDHKDYSMTAQNDLRAILSLSATLGIVDGLVGLTKDWNMGCVTHLVVNGHVYNSQDVLNAILKALNNQGRTGVNYLNNGQTSDVISTISTGDLMAWNLINTKPKLNSNAYSDIAQNKMRDILNDLGNVKLTLSIGALVQHGSLKEL